MRFRLAAMFSWLFLAGCPSPPTVPAGQPPVSPAANGSLVFNASGMIFPTVVAGFDRGPVTSYRDDGTDLSVAYSIKSLVSGVEATVYVYPAPVLVSIGSPEKVEESARRTLIRNEYDTAKAAIVSHHSEVVLLDEREIDSPGQTPTHRGWRAIYNFSTNVGGMKVPTRSELYVFCYADAEKKWTVQYRFTYSQAMPKEQEVDRFLTDFKWTFKKPV